jgi:hypothetical protein
MEGAAAMVLRLLKSFARRAPAARLPEAPPEAVPAGRIVALPQVRPACPPADFAQLQANALSIEGMMSSFSMQVMDAVLAYQGSDDLAGHILEIGVWKGRSASIMSAHVRAGERLILCDVSQFLTEEVLGKLYARPEVVEASSRDFAALFDVASLRGAVRFAHLDSGHGYRDTLAEMALIDDVLAPNGIACLDDFTNLNYSQILPAVFKYLYTTSTDLTFFLVTNDKGYLCRRAHFDRYATFVLRQMVNEMRARGNDDAMIARTDMDPEYRPFYLRPRAPDETGDHYGPALYAACYEGP